MVVSTAPDLAARRIGRGFGNTRNLHRLGIDEERVAVDAIERHGTIRHCRRERLVRWKFFARPKVLIPAFALNPRVFGSVGKCNGSPDQFVDGASVKEIDFVQCQPPVG